MITWISRAKAEKICRGQACAMQEAMLSGCLSSPVSQGLGLWLCRVTMATMHVPALFLGRDPGHAMDYPEVYNPPYHPHLHHQKG